MTGVKFPGKTRRYTIIGNYVILGDVNPVAFDGSASPPPVESIQLELTYYQSIPSLTDDANNWINCYHPTVYTLKILHIASLYSIDDPRAQTWDTEVVRLVNGMNAQHKIDMASGSVLGPALRKTFG